MKYIGVIGIGNQFRNDDGIGVLLLEKLKEHMQLISDDITFIDGGIGGLNLLHLFSQFDIVFLIDAIDFSGKIGEIRYFSEDEIVEIKDVTHYSSHEPDILQIIKISKEIKENVPEKIYIIGIQPRNISHGSTLSDELLDNLNSYIAGIIDFINSNS